MTFFLTKACFANCCNTAIKPVRSFRFALSAALALWGVFSPPASYAETRGFVLYYLHTATHGDPRNCPHGDNGGYANIKTTAFKLHGFSQEKIARILGGELAPMGLEMLKITTTRGRINDQPANVFHYPTSAPDPQIKMMVGPCAYGFDLDGNNLKSANVLIDPETGQRGVDNQLYRVVGCFTSYNESLPVRPNHEKQIWSLYGYRMSAWLFTITSDDFEGGGDATVSFTKLLTAAGKMLRAAHYFMPLM